MATATTPRGYRYQDTMVGTPNNPILFDQQLAEDIDDDVQDLDDRLDELELDSGWVDVALGSGWLTTGAYPPQVRRIGNRVVLTGALTRSGTSGSLSSMCTIPAGYRPARAVFLPAVVTNLGTVLNAVVNTAGALAVGSGYTAGTAIGSGAVVPLVGEWLLT